MAELNLDDLQPDPHGLTFRGVRYEIPGVIPVPTIIQAVKLDETITAGQASGDEQAVKDAMQRMYDMVMELLRDLNPDVPDLRFNLDDLMLILGMVTSGQAGTTLEDAAIEVVTGGAQDDAGGLAGDGEGSDPPTVPAAATKARRSPSAKPSPAPSSA